MFDYIATGYSAGFNPDKTKAPIVAVSTLPVEYPAVTGGADFGFNMKQIPLTQGKFALVDDEDFERVNQFKWQAHCERSIWYTLRSLPRREGKRLVMRLHRLILNAPPNMQVDHINGNGLDNRKENLRLCTHSQNNWNRIKKRGSSKFKGVHWHKVGKQWSSQICYNRKKIYLGLFQDPATAAKVYDDAAKKYFGVFAKTNRKLGLLWLEQ